MDNYYPDPDDVWTDEDLKVESNNIADCIVDVADWEENRTEALAGSNIMNRKERKDKTFSPILSNINLKI